MRKEGKELDELTASLKEPLESTEIRYKILEKDFRACGEKIIADLTKYAEEQDAGVLPMITVRASEFRLTGITVTAGSCSDFRYTIRLCPSMLKVTARAV